MKNQHTPGPWAVSPYMNITSRNGTVAKTEQIPGNDDSERGANANLIATAPELLSSLQGLLESYAAYIDIDDVTNADIAEPVAKARAAIAKAEGVA